MELRETAPNGGLALLFQPLSNIAQIRIFQEGVTRDRAKRRTGTTFSTAEQHSADSDILRWSYEKCRAKCQEGNVESFPMRMFWKNSFLLIERNDNPRKKDQGRKGKERKGSKFN